jgi:formylglycine-generating enzyme required for sulfatase activity
LKYDKEETLWRAFLLNVLFAVEKKSGETEELKTLKTMLYRGLEFEKTGGVTIDLAKLGAKVAEGAIQIGLSFIPPLSALADMAKELQKSGTGNIEGSFESAIQRERTKIYVEQVRSLEQFQDKFATLIRSYISPKRLVVFVDDLDRCLPEKAIQVLEAIKLFLDVQDCIFLLGIDQDVIARGIKMKYKEFVDKNDTDNTLNFTIDGMKYLEKIIQLPFQIPPVEQMDMSTYVQGLSTEWPHEDCPKVFAEGLADNPRQIKRTVNTFLMLWKLADRRKVKLQEKIKPLRLAKVVAIQAAHSNLYNSLLREEPRYLRELEEYYRDEYATPILDTEGKETEFVNIHKPDPPPALIPFLSQRGIAAVRRILMMHEPDLQDANFLGLSPEELKLYVTLTRRIETSQTSSTVEGVNLAVEPQMINIPAGKFLMGSTSGNVNQIVNEKVDSDLKEWDRPQWSQWEQPQHTVMLPEYFIGKYPVTNVEYQAFVKDAKFAPPRGWDGDQFPAEKGGHPVVNIPWRDAIAYCKWLSEKSGKMYRLPTEAEWEKAARGENGFIYPWGNQFDPKNANTVEANIGDTSEVGQFSPQGDSPYGCADMIGNVWEWVSSLWGDEWSTPEFRYPYDAKDGRENLEAGPNTRRVTRGGAFHKSGARTNCAYRFRNRPRDFGNTSGFRVAMSIVPEENPLHASHWAGRPKE